MYGFHFKSLALKMYFGFNGVHHILTESRERTYGFQQIGK